MSHALSKWNSQLCLCCVLCREGFGVPFGVLGGLVKMGYLEGYLVQK